MNKKVTFLKSGAYAFHPVYGPVTYCKEGEEDILPAYQADAMEADGWAEVTEEFTDALESAGEEESVEDGDLVDPEALVDDEGTKGEDAEISAFDRIPPWLREGWDASAKDAMRKLQAWSVLVFNQDLVDMRKSLPKIIARLEKALEA